MIKIAHIIHPVIVDPSSDLNIAQPITFETMRIAREFAKGIADIRLYAIQYRDEDRIQLPEGFIRSHPLDRSIADIYSFKEKRKLALIKDILDVLYRISSDADYFIYTNVDIALQLYFYWSVSKIIEKGYDAFIINRRTITDKFSSKNEIPLMYAEIGKPHGGCDCFVFKKELYPKFKLGSICIGTGWIGRSLLANMISYATKFKEFRDEHLTFHIGDTKSWRQDKYLDYRDHNRKELLKIFDLLEAENGEFDPVLRSYILDVGPKRKIPIFD